MLKYGYQQLTQIEVDQKLVASWSLVLQVFFSISKVKSKRITEVIALHPEGYVYTNFIKSTCTDISLKISNVKLTVAPKRNKGY